MADELRMILDRNGPRRAQSLVVEFVARHSLSHRDVDALLISLAQDDGSDIPPIFVAAPVGAHQPDADISAATVPIFPEAATTSAEPYGIEERAESNELYDDDLAWMFEDEPEPPAPRAADDPVGQALDDLLGDWSRRGGLLTRAEVALLATRRKLSVAQQAVLLDMLERAGVDLPDLEEPRLSQVGSKRYELHGDAVRQYLRMIGRYPLIDAPREVELWSLISRGLAAREELEGADGAGLSSSVRERCQAQVLDGRHAHAELVCANLRLVVSIAKARHYEFSGVEFADRIEDGNLGLMRAADKFDGSKGFKFSTYATWWIRQSIERGIGDRGRTIRIPIHVHERVQQVRRAVAKLTARLDREPTLAEIVDATKFEPGEVQSALDLMHPLRSLDELLGDEGDLHLSDVLVHEEARDGRTDPAQIVTHAMLREDIAHTLRTLLPDRAARIIERRFGLGTGVEDTLDIIGADYGVTRERIRQIQDKSLATLRKSEQAVALRSYLDPWVSSSSISVERKST